MVIAISATAFVGSLGINTHIDFAAYGYQNLATVETDINYLGVKIIRDSAETATDAQTWLQVAKATGAKFDDYIAETSPAAMATDLGFVRQLAQEGILASLEGGNEEDDSYPASLGNTLPITARFQQQVYALGQQLNLPVINMSFGAGWTAANNWQGDYGAVGDLSADARYANAHTYPNPGQLPDDTIQRMNGLAALAASTRKVVTTEIGWDTTVFGQQAIAKYILDAAMDGVKDGDAGMYFYGLYDDASGAWGLFNANGTPRPSATALHNLTTLLTDTNVNATSFTPGSLNYTLSGTHTGDNSVLIEKSNGQFWLSLWNETEAANAPHTITVNLGILAAMVVEFDPLTGTSSIASWSNVSTLQVSVPDHPVLLEIVPGSGGPVTSGPPPATPSGPTFTLPSGEAATTGTTIAVAGVSVIDSFAASNPGTLTLNVSASSGLVTMTSGGGKLAGSGTHAISVNGTLAQINADLATLRYTAASSGGNDVVTVDVWDQAGLEGTKSFDVAVTASAPVSTTPAPPPSGPVITVPASDTVKAGSTTTITGISIADPFAASNPGSLVLNVSAGTGFVAMTDTSGAKVTGSGTHGLSVTGTLAQINADLGHLGYTAGGSAGTDSVLIDVWDQAGIEASKSIAMTVTAAAAPPPPTMPSIKIAATDAAPVIAVNGTTINAGSGNHLFFIGGTGDVLTAIGGTETVMAFQGGNTITTGAGDDTIRIAGSGNVVTAGAGTNQIDDSGSNNRIVLPQGRQGFDNIYGYVLQQHDTLDLRPLLAATAWTGNAALIGNFVKVAAPDQVDATITVDPSGIVGGASYSVATLHGSGPVSLSELLSASLV